MGAPTFDRLAVTFAHPGTRRSALAVLSALGLTGLLAQEAAAQCLPNGVHCDPKATSNDCCSGKCSRRRKKCRPAPDQGNCSVQEDTCAAGPFGCNFNADCACYITIRGWSLCGDTTHLMCSFPACKKDDDCNRLTGKGSRCVSCPSVCASGTFCVQPCSPPA